MRNNVKPARIVPLALAAVLVGGLGATAATPAQARDENRTSAQATDAYYLRFDKGSVTNSRLELVQRTSSSTAR
ncbi:hypothetical protein M2271_002900 [Streptomyces sp. LBL]|uniref:hypothetical protein n=1 Tax=Streptomyces sp. LBL TaxID=2940562 RepID=UPI0024750C1B|nr:hypothetical protein [Streptomyces sp. LBL]MDH6625096.1 hypothetical protein [Streptomyces sp. LBL]